MDPKNGKAGNPYVRTHDGKPPAILDLSPNAFELLKAFRRRWVLALSLGIALAAIAGTVAYFVAPAPKYVTRAQLFVSAEKPYVVFPNEAFAEDGGAYHRRQIALLKTRQVLLAALREKNIANYKSIRDAKDPIEWLEKNIQAEYVSGGEVLRITLSGDDPQEITDIVNAVVDAYMKEIVHREREDRLNRLRELKDIHTKSEASLETTRSTLKKLAEDVGSSDAKTIEMRRQFAMEQLSVHQRELIQLRSDLNKSGVDLAALQAKAKAQQDLPVADSEVEAYFAKDPMVEQLRKQINDKDAEIAANAARLKDAADPYFAAARRQLADLQERERSYREKLRPRVVEQLRAKTATEAKSNMESLQEKIALWKAQENVLVQLIDRLREDSKEFQRTTVSLESLRRDMELSEELNRIIAGTVRKLEYEATAQSRVQPLEKAEVPQTKDDKPLIRLVAMACVGAFALAVGGVSFWEFQGRRVGTVEQVVTGLGMPLVGALPPFPSRSLRLLGRSDEDAEAEWQSRLTESIDAARTMLLHRAQQDNLRVVMITSAVSGEGKTSVSCHLATSLARAGHRTLLIDCDLRRPAAHRLFALPSEPGFSELLRGDATEDEVVQSTSIDDLWLIPAGAWDAKTTRALAQGRIAEHLEKFKKSYDFVIVDSSPVLPVVDAILVGKYVDGVLFSVLRDVSRLPMVYAAHQRMAALGVLMLGAIVNGTTDACYAYQYSYRGVS